MLHFPNPKRPTATATGFPFRRASSGGSLPQTKRHGPHECFAMASSTAGPCPAPSDAHNARGLRPHVADQADPHGAGAGHSPVWKFSGPLLHPSPVPEGAPPSPAPWARPQVTLKNGLCSSCLPPLTTGSSYSNCRCRASGSPLTSAARALPVKVCGDRAAAGRESHVSLCRLLPQATHCCLQRRERPKGQVGPTLRTGSGASASWAVPPAALWLSRSPHSTHTLPPHTVGSPSFSCDHLVSKMGRSESDSRSPADSPVLTATRASPFLNRTPASTRYVWQQNGVPARGRGLLAPTREGATLPHE